MRSRGLSGLANCAPGPKLSTAGPTGPEGRPAVTEISRIPVRDLRGERQAVRRADGDRAMIQREDRRERAERHTGYAVYWLYLTSPFSIGVTGLIGLLMAAARKGDATPVNGSHFRFQVWTFWSALLASATGGAWAALGSIASVGGAAGGGELVLAGAGLAALAGIGFMGASIFGLSRLVSREPVGRLSES